MDSAAQEPTDSDEGWKDPVPSIFTDNVGREWTIDAHSKDMETKWGRRYRTRDAVVCQLLYHTQLLCVSYPHIQRSKVLRDASRDLKVLAVCAITGLAPVGIFADKLEEEYPDLKEAADHLREWERLA